VIVRVVGLGVPRARGRRGRSEGFSRAPCSRGTNNAKNRSLWSRLRHTVAAPSHGRGSVSIAAPVWQARRRVSAVVHGDTPAASGTDALVSPSEEGAVVVVGGEMASVSPSKKCRPRKRRRGRDCEGSEPRCPPRARGF
jgi:hypothetical protein